jgi:hypothetical protein
MVPVVLVLIYWRTRVCETECTSTRRNIRTLRSVTLRRPNIVIWSFPGRVHDRAAILGHVTYRGVPVRRLCAVLVLCLVSLLTVGSGVANAGSQEVKGKGDIKRMSANNGTKALTAQVVGVGRPCSGARDLSVQIVNRNNRILYIAQGVCTAGVQWDTTLYYTATGDIQDEKRVPCRNFKFTRNNTTGAYRIVIPRGCLDNAPNRVRVKSEGVNYGSATGGHAGPTKLLTRG